MKKNPRHLRSRSATWCVVLVALSLLNGCSTPGKGTVETIPPPPVRLSNNNGQIMLPQPSNPHQQVISESAAAIQAESQPYARRQITEDRGPGGAVNKITVDQSGNVPNYYIYPNSATDTNTNNNPDRIAPPNWQFSW